MNRLARLLAQGSVASTLCTLILVAPAAARTWTDTQGRKIEAEFAGVRDGIVQLKDASGKTLSIAIEKLSAEDRRAVAAEIGAKTAVAPAAPAAAAPVPAAAPSADVNDRFSEAIRQNPESSEAYYQRGLSRLNHGEAKEALADFDQAVKFDPSSAEGYDGRGQAHAALGEPASATKDYDKAIELKPGLAAAYEHRADNLKNLANSPAGKEMLDAKIEDYRKMYQAAREKQLSDSAWQPLNTTSGPTTRQGIIGQLAKLDYDKAKQLEQGYRAGKGSGGGYGSGSGSGSGSGKGMGKESPPGPAPRKGPNKPMEEPSPESPESGVVVMPEKVSKGENVVLIADPDKLAAGLSHEAGAKSPAGKSSYGKSSSAEGRGAAKSANSAAGNKKAEDQLAMVKEVDFYRDKDGDGKLDTSKDELLATDADSQDGYSAEVSTANFPVGKQKYFAAPKVAGREPAKKQKKSPSASDSAAGESASAGKGQSDSEYALSNSKKGKAASDEYQPAEPVALASAAVSGSGEVVPPEQANEKPAKEEKSAGGPASGSGPGKGMAKKPGKRGGGYAGPRGSKAARAVERALGYVDRGEYGPAVTEYNNLLTEYVDDPYYLTGRAGVHLTQGGYDLAIRDYNRVIEVDAPTAEIYYNRGCAQLAVGNLAAAVDDFSASLKLDELGKFANLALNNRGTAYGRQGRLDLATADFNEAIKLNPNDPLAYRNRSLAQRKLGKTSEADADLAKAKQLGGA